MTIQGAMNELMNLLNLHRHCKYSGFCRLRDVTAEIRKGGGLA